MPTKTRTKKTPARSASPADAARQAALRAAKKAARDEKQLTRLTRTIALMVNKRDAALLELADYICRRQGFKRVPARVEHAVEGERVSA